MGQAHIAVSGPSYDRLVTAPGNPWLTAEASLGVLSKAWPGLFTDNTVIAYDKVVGAVRMGSAGFALEVLALVADHT